MAKTKTQSLSKVAGLVREMIIVADEGEAEATNDGCVVVYGVVRDCAYKIKKVMENECQGHRH